jgi:hypothetical protein
MANLGSTLIAGQPLNQNDYLLSPTGVGQLILQDDGNLVFYMNPGANQRTLWASGTNGQDSQYAIMQTDGNFAICDPNENILWSTESPGAAGHHFVLIVSDEGFQIIDEDTGSFLFYVGPNMQRK